MKIGFTALLVSFFLTLSAQSDSLYQKDLESLFSILQKTPSFRDQIRGQKRLSYLRMLEQLKKDTIHNPSDFRYFFNLSKLFFPVHDNHLAFYQTAGLPDESAYPSFMGNRDSLQSVLRNKPLDSIEGIYYYGDFYTVGLYNKPGREYEAVVLESGTPKWKPGQIAFHLYEQSPGYYRAIYTHPSFKNYMYYPVEKFINHSLVNAHFYNSLTEKVYSKVKQMTDHVNIPSNDYPFQLRVIRPDIQYLLIRNFSADMRSMKKSELFYDSIKHSLNAPFLILDLRNNEGGAFKVSKRYLRLLDKYTRKGKIYVLVNNGTMSQGEIFILQLKEFRNVKILGQTTRGALAYGSNYGKRVKPASNNFEVYITDMRGDKKLVPFEDFGINPDILLLNNKDWIEQAVEIISGKRGNE